MVCMGKLEMGLLLYIPSWCLLSTIDNIGRMDSFTGMSYLQNQIQHKTR